MVSVSDFPGGSENLTKAISFMESSGMTVVHFDGVIPNPTTDVVSAGAKIAQENDVDVIVGIGGGSSMDTAKAIAVEAAHEGSAWDYLFYKKEPTSATLPVVLVPTTSGTGSHVTQCTVVTKSEDEDKSALWHDNLFARAAIVDPDLAATMPSRLTALTGFDAFCHNFEAFISRGTNIYVKSIALHAIELIAEYLPRVVADGSDMDAREAMYIDRRLGGIQAIQTLSRLNRMCPGKSDTFVLDFVNSEEEIQQAFQPYYETTIVGEQVDYGKLYELQAKLDGYRIYYPEEVDRFAKVFFDLNKSSESLKGSRLNAALDPAVDRFKEREEPEQEEFRSTVVSFVNVYAFLAQIIPFQDSDLEKLYTFLWLLRRKLPRKGRSSLYDIEGDVALKYYRLQKISEGDIGLDKGEQYPIDGPTDVGTSAAEPSEEELSRIIDVLNEKFKTDFTPADELFIDSIREDAVQDRQVRDAAAVNTMENFGFVFKNRIDDLIVERMEQNESITSRFLNDKDFKEVITTLLLKKVYDQVRMEMGVGMIQNP